MEAVCGGAKPYLNTAHLESEHLRIKERAIDLFSKKPKMGGEEFSKQYKAKLDEVNCSNRVMLSVKTQRFLICPVLDKHVNNEFVF